MMLSRFFLYAILCFEMTSCASTTIDRECTLTTTVSCHIASNHKDCDEIVMKANQCRDIEVLFGFRYCNLHRHTSVTLVTGEMKVNDGMSFLEPLNDENNLEPMSCKELTKSFMMNTCSNKFQAEMVAEGWIDHEIRCQSDDIFFLINPMYESLN